VKAGTFAIVVATALIMVAVASAKHFGSWGAPVNAETLPGSSSELNTPFNDGCPIQSPDGHNLYMASNRPGTLGGQDIWVAHRPNRHAGWGTPVNLGRPVNSDVDDFCPLPLRGHRLMFVSARPGGCGGPDIYSTRFRDGAWEEPQNLGCGINSGGAEASPSLFRANGHRVLYFSSARAGGFAADTAAPDSDIYMSVDFGQAELVPGLNTALEDSRPNVRHDGLELVFDSARSGTLGGPDIWTATRDKPDGAWSEPIHLDQPINSSASETRASLSRDGTQLVFGSTRPGSELAPTGQPSNDVYVAEREHGKK
jgi:WD40-like Beta Propeller Repeat